MGVGIALCEGSCWLPAGWVGRNAADYIIPQLRGPAAMATKARLDKMYLYPGSIAFFEDASPQEVQALANAVALGIAKLKEDGPRGWHMPEAFPGFVSAFEQLRDYIDLDPRVRGLPPKRLSPPSGRTFSIVFFANDEPG